MDASYSNPEIESRLRSVALSSGFNAWLDFRLVAAGGGQVELELPVRQEMQQHHGFVHGGVVGTLADTAAAWAAATVSGDVVTSSYTLHLLAPAIGRLIRARAQVIKSGKRNLSVEAKVYAEADGAEPKLVAVALAAIAVIG
jgi:uncharacterized protein (TIGR00369 family)